MIEAIVVDNITFTLLIHKNEVNVLYEPEGKDAFLSNYPLHGELDEQTKIRACRKCIVDYKNKTNDTNTTH